MPAQSKFARRVLCFNPNKKLININQSAFAIAKAYNWNLSSIRAACTGKLIAYQNLYFRYLEDDIEVGFEDLGVLSLEEYDQLCGVNRKTFVTGRMDRKGMEYNKKPKEKSPYYPFKSKPFFQKDERQSNQQI